jgi:hypothetical protein
MNVPLWLWWATVGGFAVILFIDFVVVDIDYLDLVKIKWNLSIKEIMLAR